MKGAVGTNDPDCDGFDWAKETSIGTWEVTQCPETTMLDDEFCDAWPPDLNDDALVNIIDVLGLKPVFGEPAAGVGRFDLSASGDTIDIIDVLAFKPFFGAIC